MPNLLKDDVPWETRLELVRKIGSNARKRFEEKYPTIEEWFRDYDALYVLSYCAFYLLSYPEGTDPEATGELQFHHYYIEIMQGFALCQERNLNPKPMLEEAARLQRSVREIGELIGLRLFDLPAEVTTEQQASAHRLRAEMMMHTTAIRNWAYPDQMRRIVFDLCNLIHAEFESIYGIDPRVLFDLLLRLTEERADLLNAHRDKLRTFLKENDYKKVISAYNASFPENVPIEDDSIEEIWQRAGRKRRTLKAMLLSHSDLKLEDIYTFSLDHAHALIGNAGSVDALRKMLDNFSLGFGDLKDFKREHFILGNPVLARPFIKATENAYYSAIWGVMPHLLLDLLEDLVWAHPGLKETYTRAKGQYLEDELERIVRSGFPSANISRGSLWRDPNSSKDFENDLTIVLDSFAIVAEAKSASITDPARRGAPERLFGTLRDLIEDPSDQALRFVGFLKDKPGVHHFSTKRGVTNVIDSSSIKHYIPLGVTLSHLGMISSNLKKLVSAEVVSKTLDELAPSMSLTDLECVLELLPLEVEKLHYLARRREFEAHVEYQGDELDLLAFYLDNGFNIGETEYGRDVSLYLVMKSKELDPYFVGSREDKKVEKPCLAMSKWWRDMLSQISERKIDGWAETGYILLNSTKADQEKFETEFKALARRIVSGVEKKPHNWVMFLSGPARRRFAIAGYLYETTDKEVRNSIMSDILEGEDAAEARGAVVIGVSLTRGDYPYTVLARRAATDLFDTLAV